MWGKETVCALLCVLDWIRLFATPWTVAFPAPLSMKFSRQEYWSGLLYPSPGGLPYPGIEPTFSALAGEFFLPLAPLKSTHNAIEAQGLGFTA